MNTPITRRRMNGDPREDLAWVLKEVVYGLPVKRRPPEEQASLWQRLARIVDAATAGAWRPDLPETTTLKMGRATVQFPRSPSRRGLSSDALDELGRAQRVARNKLVEAFATGFSWHPSVARLAGAVEEVPGGSQFRGSWQGPLSECLIPALVALLGKALPNQLRTCPYQASGTDAKCQRVFVAIKRQMFCPLHRDARRRDRDTRARARYRQRQRQAQRQLRRRRLSPRSQRRGRA
jgi:hypothetical protein